MRYFLKFTLGIVLFVLGTLAHAQVPVYYTDGLAFVHKQAQPNLTVLTGIGDQGANDATLAEAISAGESPANRVSFGLAVLAGLEGTPGATNSNVLPDTKCISGGTTYDSITNSLQFVQCDANRAQTDFNTFINDVQPFCAVLPSGYCTTDINQAQLKLTAYINDVLALTSMPAPIAATGSPQMNAIYGARGGMGYLNVGFNSDPTNGTLTPGPLIDYLESSGALGNATVTNAVLSHANNLFAILNLQATGFEASVGISTHAAGIDALIGDGNAPSHWYSALSGWNQGNVPEDSNGDAGVAHEKFVDAWQRTDIGAYWLTQF